MKIVDTRGMACPAPLIATRRALTDTKENQTFKIVIDNKISFSNISRYLNDNGIAYSSLESDGIWTITVTRNSNDMPVSGTNENSDIIVPHFLKGDFIMVFTSDKLGEGDDKLGHILAENFIRAVKDLDSLPKKMVFYNKGVLLGIDSSPVIDHLREIEKMGVELLFCSTCINFYSLEEKIRVGTISNMYEIAQAMASAGKVIKP